MEERPGGYEKGWISILVGHLILNGSKTEKEERVDLKVGLQVSGGSGWEELRCLNFLETGSDIDFWSKDLRTR